ncbi:MAG: cyclomaltodextrinase N-terminal domain-containing protein [Prevotellaceae bacterium]|nr:cyclomaltodextrinase N-terminal domain-containing protein [Prevotellaceae bacterium]
MNIKAEVSHVEPPYWWTEMRNPQLQLMVYGTNLHVARVSISHPGVRIDRVERINNPNYLFIYLNIDRVARAGVFDITFNINGTDQVIPYELRLREAGSAQRRGFSGDDVLYLIMPDRFVNGLSHNDYFADMGDAPNRSNQYSRHGGDIAGIASRLGYLSNLGVTGISLTPVVENNVPVGSYHGFSPTNFYKVDQRLGTNDELVSLVKAAHNRGLKIVLEVDNNHCSSRHPWIKSLPTPDWVTSDAGLVRAGQQYAHIDEHASNYDKNMVQNGWFSRILADLNQKNKFLSRYLIQNTIWWIESTGADGIKSALYTYSDFDFLAQWNEEILIEYPNLSIAGETWYSKEAAVAWWQRNSKLSPRNTNLKVVMDFPFATTVAPYAFTEETSVDQGLNRVHQLLTQDFLYPDPFNILTFVDNIDLSRFYKSKEKGLKRYKQAMAFLLTSRGIPQITYGTEILMTGEKIDGDGMLCPDFPGGWKIDRRNAFLESERISKENEAYKYLQKLLTWRSTNDAVKRGKMKQFVPDDGIYAYARYTPSETVIVMFNGKNTSGSFNTLPLTELLHVTPIMRDVITGKRVDITQPIRMGARDVMILQAIR